jgi:pilus assembly protein Flp/PilA
MVRTSALELRYRIFDRGNHMTAFKRLLKDESGATAIEYGLIAAGISVAIIATVQGLGTKLNSTFTSVQNALN